MLQRRFPLLAALALTFLLASGAQAADIVRLATTTSTYNSGLLDYLLPKFEQDHPYQVQVIPVGTGKALRLGRDGDVDVVLTHAPGAEKAFVDAGYGVEPHGVMYNDFVIVGPADDPAGIEGGDDATRAFATLADEGATFISRGDDSGTEKKENHLWQDAGTTPDFEGYRSAGQGMGAVLNMASELQGYTLTDRGTWLAMKDKLDLEIMVEGDKALFNPYQVILVNPERHEGLNTQGARALAEWLISDEGQDLIDAFRLNDKVLFHASAGEKVDPSAAVQEND
ncbi:tungstate transport system substrate-binding protein [Chromohalobacter marismortui]|uniref:Tungstate transport system substrate-binding protein n=1 Tax=Chromohalobacter marismortui TaxID=42055 RepID=A0A4R7NQI5_9GAMM|nr:MULTISPECIES: substrate-binding domain-containing protein [Chromohalobacter]MCI0508733.1 substrate-binding domain-containing protein [Chromohalobacter sp.]MCI0594622.1 substrate-binding domain-containing protein [Chromohalobacter sp.]TDU22902.1 tungstate transport system substrate-binding protein [Chromohalobacter marismortui]